MTTHVRKRGRRMRQEPKKWWGWRERESRSKLARRDRSLPPFLTWKTTSRSLPRSPTQRRTCSKEPSKLPAPGAVRTPASTGSSSVWRPSSVCWASTSTPSPGSSSPGPSSSFSASPPRCSSSCSPTATPAAAGAGGRPSWSSTSASWRRRRPWPSSRCSASRTTCASTACASSSSSERATRGWTGCTGSMPPGSRLACNLQVIHFEEYGQLLQHDTEVSMLLEEHTSLCYYLSKISHRFRIHLLLVFFISVTSQFVTLLLATQYAQLVDFVNAGDFAVCAAVQVIGIVLCLNAATRISHRAQSLASLASRWHVLATCRSASDLEKIADVNCTLEVSAVNQAIIDHPREGGISSDIAMQGKEQSASFTSLHYQRQALVMYLQSNSSGITVYGWAVDRGLINTIFAIELSLLLFVFGRTL